MCEDVIMLSVITCSNIIMPSMRPQLCHPSMYVVSPPVLSAVVNNSVQHLVLVVDNHCPLCWQHQSQTGGVPASFRRAICL